MRKFLYILVCTSIFVACKKTELPVSETTEGSVESTAKRGGGGNGGGTGGTTSYTITTSSVYVGSMVMVVAHGSIGSSNGGKSVSDRGFCYSTSPGPTMANDTARAGSGAGAFERLITGLTGGTTYYIRAYGIRNGIVSYGNELSFTTLTMGYPSAGIGTVYDFDGNAYNTITLGTQVWMLENLKTTHYRDGSPITKITGDADWRAATAGAYCDYNNDPANGQTYGRIYNLHAIKDARNLAPAGWHLPNFGEWLTLLNFLGGSDIAGGRMKETGFTHWLSPNIAADNSSGFTGLGGGGRNIFTLNGAFAGLKERANLWSSSSRIDATSTYINIIYLDHDAGNVIMTLGGTSLSGTTFGASVRCVKD